jgi:hypothetical protein
MSERDSVEFSAILKKLEVKSLVSGDKGGRLILEFNIYDDELISQINRLMKADAECNIAIDEIR